MSDPADTPTFLSRLGPVVRPILAAFPYAGGSLATLWSEWDTSRKFKRVEGTVLEILRNLELRGDRYDFRRLGDAEMQILEAALEKAQSEHREAKRKRFARLVAAAWTDHIERPFEERMRFVRALDELDETHVGILAFLAQQADEGRYPNYPEVGDAVGIAENERDEVLLPALDTLASGHGFIRRAWGLASGQAGVLISETLSVEGIARNCEHTITEAGRRFLEAVTIQDDK